MSDRLDALRADLQAVYPGATVAASDAHAARRFRVVPSARHPRLAVPADVPAAARTALRRTTAADSRASVLARAAVGAVAASAASRYAFRTEVTVSNVGDDSVEHFLAKQTGADVRFSVQIGSSRANAKPVLGVYTTSGSEVAFCKVGLAGSMTERLVEHEATALRRVRVARPRAYRVPGVLHAGRWSGGSLLLLTPERGQRTPRDKHLRLPIAAMQELVALDGVRTLPLAHTPWAERLRSGVEALVAETARSAPSTAPPALRHLVDDLGTAAARLLDRDGDRRMPIGAWHGDFGPWNMAWHGPGGGSDAPPRVVVWDWERLDDGVPGGLDAVHFVAHAALRLVGDQSAALRALRERAEPAVAAVVRGWVAASDLSDVVRVVIDCYLLEIALRFGGDAARTGKSAVAGLAQWYATVSRTRLGVAEKDGPWPR